MRTWREAGERVTRRWRGTRTGNGVKFETADEEDPTGPGATVLKSSVEDRAPRGGARDSASRRNRACPQQPQQQQQLQRRRRVTHWPGGGVRAAVGGGAAPSRPAALPVTKLPKASGDASRANLLLPR